MSVRRLAAGVNPVALARTYPECHSHLLGTAFMGGQPSCFSVLFAFPERIMLGDERMAVDHHPHRPAALAIDSLATPGEPNSVLSFHRGWFITRVFRGAGVRFCNGAGIVADSDPAAELEKTRHKDRARLDALCQ